MTHVTIISGCPGSGKTTLARLLANRSEMGVHLTTDDFYRFLAHPLDPSTPESNDQNTAVVRSFLHAARSFAEDGYAVYIDGVIGPWWLDTITEIFPAFDYAILHADLATVLQRTGQRASTAQISATPDLVRTMHKQFDRLAEIARRRIETESKSARIILTEFIHKQAQGDFAPPSSRPNGDC